MAARIHHKFLQIDELVLNLSEKSDLIHSVRQVRIRTARTISHGSGICAASLACID